MSFHSDYTNSPVWSGIGNILYGMKTINSLITLYIMEVLHSIIILLSDVHSVRVLQIMYHFSCVITNS